MSREPKLRGMGVVATLREGVRVAIDSLRANKVRSGLTILGVTIGVVVVMVMAAMVQGLNSSFEDVVASSGPTTFYVFHAPVGGGGGVNTGLEEEENEFMKNPPLDPKWARELNRLPGIKHVGVAADLSQSGFHAQAGQNDVRITLYAVDSEYMDIDGGDVVDGRWFTRTEDQRRRPVAIVDSVTALDLWEGRDPLSQKMYVGRPNRDRTPFTTIGLYRPPQNLFSGLASHYVMIPFSSALKYMRFWDRMIWFTVMPEEGVPLEDALDVVRSRMRTLRALGPKQADNFHMITQDQMMDFWNNLTGVFFSVMVALSGVGLLVGGIGVIGIMMISVTERTREIGLRKAMGARRRDLLWQFLVEAASLTLLGGAIGMAVGGLVVWLVAAFTPLPAEVPLWSIVTALLASILTGIVFGLIPAARGARLDPVEALRYE